MPRIARLLVPGYLHHMTQRGNRRQRTFFRDDDYWGYLALMGNWCGRCAVEIRADCLMPNHVQLIVEMNPVRARMVARPQAYPWSGTSAHRKCRDDALVKFAPLSVIVSNWRKFPSYPAAAETGLALRHHQRTSRPLRDENFLTHLVGLLNRELKAKKPGRKLTTRKK